MGEHQHPRGTGPAVGGEERVEVLADRAVGVPDVVGAPEGGERTEARQVVEVDQPEVHAVGERVVEGLRAAVLDEHVVEGGAPPRHHVTPSEAAARTPEAQPSSWKPQPW